jgi:hypothetical protein
MPATGSIQMTYPQQITLTASTECIVDITGFSFPYSDGVCVLDKDAQTITIKEIFQAAAATQPYSDEIIVTLTQVENPPTNKPGNGFVIQTYLDESLSFLMDKLPDFKLFPQFLCEYPCRSCDPNNRNDCETCWQTNDNPRYLMVIDDVGTCKSACDNGWTTNGLEATNYNC